MLLNGKLVESGKCPTNQSSISPCICKTDTIHCGGNENFNLTNIFKTISSDLRENEKHFQGFYFNNTGITEFESNLFNGLKFGIIFIENALSLRKISSNAFESSNNSTKTFFLRYSPVEYIANDYNIYEALNSMINLEKISLIHTNITVLPDNAFHSTNGSTLNNLALIYIVGSLQTIGNNAFQELNNLETIDFFNSSFNFIPENAFQFTRSSNKSLFIGLGNNKNLNESSFDSKPFSSFKRRFIIELFDDKNIKYLKENIFGPVLINENELLVKNITFWCDCRMFWIFKNREKFMKQMTDVLCIDGKSIMHSNKVFIDSECNSF